MAESDAANARPGDLDVDLEFELRVLPRGTVLGRVYRSEGAWPRTWNGLRRFGPLASRWDHHLPDDAGRPRLRQRGVLCAAAGDETITTCLAEVFQTTWLIDRNLDRPAFVGFALARDVPLVDLTGRLPTRLGASTAVHSGSRPRARALYDAWPMLEGVLYCSSMNADAPAIVLFERASDALPDAPLVHRFLSDPSLAPAVRFAASECGHGLVPREADRLA